MHDERSEGECQSLGVHTRDEHVVGHMSDGFGGYKRLRGCTDVGYSFPNTKCHADAVTRLFWGVCRFRDPRVKLTICFHRL
jgi:hypothetical protein